MSNLLSTYTNSGPVAGGGGGGGSTLTYTTTTPESVDYLDINAQSGTFTFAASIPANSRLVRIIWDVVTPFAYTSWGYTTYIGSTAQILLDGQLLTPMGSYAYTSGTTIRKTTASYGEIFGLNGATGKLVECAPDFTIGGATATPQLKWDEWYTHSGSPTPTTQGEVKVSFEYLVIS